MHLVWRKGDLRLYAFTPLRLCAGAAQKRVCDAQCIIGKSHYAAGSTWGGGIDEIAHHRKRDVSSHLRPNSNSKPWLE